MAAVFVGFPFHFVSFGCTGKFSGKVNKETETKVNVKRSEIGSGPHICAVFVFETRQVSYVPALFAGVMQSDEPKLTNASFATDSRIKFAFLLFVKKRGFACAPCEKHRASPEPEFPGAIDSDAPEAIDDQMVPLRFDQRLFLPLRPGSRWRRLR